MAYQSIFSGGNFQLPDSVATIPTQFTPGKYAAVNSQIAASSKTPASDLPTLRTQLKSGAITQDQFISQFNKITNNNTAPAPYSPGNLAWAVGNALNQVFVQTPKDAVVTTAQKAGNQFKYLSQAPATQSQQDTILKNQAAAAKNPEYLKATKGLNPAANSAQGHIQAQRMAASGAKAPEIRKALAADAQALEANNRQGFENAGVIATMAPTGEGVGAKLLKTGFDYVTGRVGGEVAKEAASKAVGETLLGRAIQKAKGITNRPASALDKFIPEETSAASEAATTAEKPAVAASTPKATTTAPAASSEPTAPTTKVSGSALKSEQRAVEANLTKEFEGKATYNPGSYKTESANAVKLVHENPDEAKAIALGNEPGNNTIHEVAVRRAVEKQALDSGDTETLRLLANSSSHTATSEAAQRLGSEAFNADPRSPVDAMKEVINARKAAVEKQLGTSADKAITTTTKAIKAAVPKVTHQTWGDFVESIRC